MCFSDILMKDRPATLITLGTETTATLAATTYTYFGFPYATSAQYLISVTETGTATNQVSIYTGSE